MADTRLTEEQVNTWFARIDAAQKLADLEKPVWDQLEAAVDGAFPPLIEPSADVGEDSGYLANFNGNRFRSGDQLDVNLMGRALRYKIADAFDMSPSLKFTRKPTTDVDVSFAMSKLASKLMDEGDAVSHCRRGMELAHTRGQSIVWPIFIRDRVTEPEIVAAKIPPGQFVENVLHGGPVEVPLGADLDGIVRAAKEALSPIDKDGKDSIFYYQLTEKQKSDLTLLQIKAERESRKKREGPHGTNLRAKINYECTPYSTFCLTDSGVTDFSRVSWILRFIPMTWDEFQADPTFTDEAKREVMPAPSPKTDRGVPVPPVTTLGAGGADYGASAYNGVRKTIDMEGRILVAEIWDKINWKRIYLVMGYGKEVGKTNRYPYMDLFGRPLFPDFFPCVWRTPWSRMTENATRVLGLPGLEPMWPLNIEYIKAVSAFVTACKMCARIGVVGPGIDQKSLTAWSKARDGSYIQMSAEYNAQIHGDPAKQFTQLPMPPAPRDFLEAAELVKHEAYESVSITSASMTGAPQASTASQENLISQGASTVAGDTKAIFEDAYAELAKKSLMMFLEFANEHEVEAYLGPEALLPRPPNTMPEMDPMTGEPMPQPPRPSIYEAMTTTDLVGEKLEARFASSTRAQDFMRLKTLGDILAQVNVVRDATGAPYKDPREILTVLLQEADVDAGDYKPSEAEIAMRVAAMVSNRGIGAEPPGGEGGEKPGGGDPTSRTAGGGRGVPAKPGAQSRGRAPSPNAPAVASGVGLRRGNNART